MSTSVASLTTNFFPTAQNGFTTTTAGSVASGATTVTLNSVAGYTNGKVVVLVIDPTDAAKKQTFTGVVDTAGVQITSVVWTAGTNQTHALGATVVDYETATHWNMIEKGMRTEHNANGTHGAVTASSVTVATGKITTTAVDKLEDAGTALSTYRANTMFDHVASGGVWSGDSYGVSRNASMTALVCYINGRRISIGAVTARSFTASKDTYVDVLDNADGTGTLVYTEVANNAASPALASNSIRIAIIVTGASNIANVGSINQGQENKILPTITGTEYMSVTDSLGNLICPRDPNRSTLGYRQFIANLPSLSSTSQAQVTGLRCPVIMPSNRKVVIEVMLPGVIPSAAIAPSFTIWRGTVGSGTQLQRVEQVMATASNSYGIVLNASDPDGSGSVTYNVGYAVPASNITIGASSTAPASMRVRLV